MARLVGALKLLVIAFSALFGDWISPCSASFGSVMPLDSVAQRTTIAGRSNQPSIRGANASLQRVHSWDSGKALRKASISIGSIGLSHRSWNLAISGYRPQPFKGMRNGIWSITASEDWRLTLHFVDGNVHLLNYEDYTDVHA